MKYECDLIEDLLPLYIDSACGKTSKQIVEEHLAECEKCSEMLKSYKDTEIDEDIVKEKQEIIDSQAKYFKKKTTIAGSFIGGIFATPILICLIVNLATGQGLSWFFIVLSAMLIPASLIVVPLMAPKNRMFTSVLSFTGSLLVLLATCCIYTGGNWFFLVAPCVIFALSLVFMPILACRRPLSEQLKNKKGLAVMTEYTITFFIMLVCIGLYVRTTMYFAMAFGISIPMVAMIWTLFLIIRYLPVNGWTKAGICAILVVIFDFVADRVIELLMMRSVTDNVQTLYYSQFSNYGTLPGLAVGVVLLLIGLIAGSIGKQKKQNVVA